MPEKMSRQQPFCKLKPMSSGTPTARASSSKRPSSEACSRLEMLKTRGCQHLGVQPFNPHIVYITVDLHRYLLMFRMDFMFSYTLRQGFKSHKVPALEGPACYEL